MTVLREQKISPRWKIILALGIVYIVWGSTFLAIRIGVQSIPPFFLAGTRFLIAGLILYFYSRWTSPEKPTHRHWISATQIGVLLLVTGNGLVVWAEQVVPSGMASFIISTIPLWMVCLPAFSSRSHRPSTRIVVGLVLGFLGVFILMPMGKGNVFGYGPNAALLVAALSWSFGTIYAKRAVLPKSPLLASGMEMISGGIILFLLSELTGEWPRLMIHAIPLMAWAGLLYLIFFGSVIAFSAYMWLTTQISTTLLSTYAYINPIVAVFLGWLCLGEVLSLRLLLGALVILIAVILISL